MKNFLLSVRDLFEMWGGPPGPRPASRPASCVVIAFLLMAGALAAADTPFWIAPCENPDTGCKARDADLARWALASWETASGGRLHFVETKDRTKALIRMIWASPSGGLYGETV